MSDMKIWGRDLRLDDVFDRYSDEEVLRVQEDALRNFVSAEGIGDLSLEMVKNFCASRNADEISGKIDNIFKYVVPHTLFVKRDGRVVIMCHYKFDMEHGLAVVYHKNKPVKVCSMDEVI